MKNFILRFSLIFLIAMLFFSPMRSDARQSNKMALPYANPQAYEVYSAVLSSGDPWKDSKSLVILQELPPREWPIGAPQDALRGDEAFRKNFDGIFKSFNQLNKQPLLLQNHFAIQTPFQIVSSAELEAAFHRPEPRSPRDGWEGFRQSFSNASGYLILSAVAFNPERTIALVFVDYRCGNLCASARYYILEKRGGHWVNFTPPGLLSETHGNS